MTPPLGSTHERSTTPRKRSTGRRSASARRRGPRLTVALVLALIVTVLPLPTASAATDRVLVITSATAGPKVAFAAFDGNPPKLFDIDGDGVMEIIAQNDNQYVYVFDSRSGELLAELKTRFPANWGARSFNGPEAVLLSRGGQVHMVVANSAAYITLYKFDPFASGKGHFAFDKLWDRRLTDCHANPGMDAKPVLVDLNKDGTFEILAATEESGLYALKSDGTLYWKNCLGGGNAEPGIGDLDQDGWPDVVHVSDGGVVAALKGRTGAWMWSYNVASNFNVGTGSMPVGPAVAQLDGVGGPDVVVGVRDSHDANNWDNDHALLLALKGNGQLLWGRQHPDANPLTYTHPVVVDADGDGEREVYWGDWNTNGHKPPFDPALAWQRLGPANFYRYDADGNLVWKQTLGTWWSNKDLALGDVDGDGEQEVLANGPNAGHDGIWYLDSGTGAKETFVDLHPYQAQRAPILADLWSTGTMQWVVQVAGTGNGGAHGILVYDTHQAFNSVWPHLPYPKLPAAAPGGNGTFGATFTIKSPNEWWQEVTVRPDDGRALNKVEVRIDGQGWQRMTLRSWGAWTSSYNSPRNSIVEFKATDPGGAISQSAPFTWLDGTLSQRSVAPNDPPPPPAPFEPTFDVSPNINEWWVEVYVGGGDPITAVDARVNGGAWTGLALTDWDSWAKSFFVARGSSVQFRATRADGAQALSGTYDWLNGG